MNEMLERVARAIWEQSVGPSHWAKWGEFQHGAWARVLSIAQARAAIAAMRKPTDAMADAALETGFVGDIGFHAPHEMAAEIYQAMIDAALDETNVATDKPA